MGVIICLDLIYNHIHVLITLILLGISIVLQLITGILLSLHYTPHINYSYYSIMYIIREVYYGSYYYNSNSWFSGIIIFIMLTAIAFIGYVLPWGQMSFWGATVITNLLSPFPC